MNRLVPALRITAWLRPRIGYQANPTRILVRGQTDRTAEAAAPLIDGCAGL